MQCDVLQDNARLTSAIAEAQQQLRAAAASAAQQALAEQDLSQQQQTRLALEQVHLLVSTWLPAHQSARLLTRSAPHCIIHVA